MRRPALLVIDMLNDFFEASYADGSLFDRRCELVGAINELIGVFRHHLLPVIWIRQEFASDLSDAPLLMKRKSMMMNIAGTDGCRMLHDLDVDPTDLEIVKKRFSAFFGTDLFHALQKMRIDTVVICGVKTDACIRVSAIDAYQHDYHVIIPLDGVASSDESEHASTLQYLSRGIAEVMDCEQVVQWVKRKHLAAKP